MLSPPRTGTPTVSDGAATSRHREDSVVFDRLSPLVTRAQGGDPEAIDQIVAELAPAVLRALTTLMGRDSPDIEDIAQEVLLAVVDALPTFRGQSTLLHFAVRIAARKSVAAKRRVKSVAGWLETLWRREHPLRPSSAPGQDDALAERRRELLRSLLGELPDAQAEAILLRVVLGYSIEEIGSITQVPFNTVRSRLRLAKVALRKRIEDEPQWAELAEGTT